MFPEFEYMSLPIEQSISLVALRSVSILYESFFNLSIWYLMTKTGNTGEMGNLLPSNDVNIDEPTDN